MQTLIQVGKVIEPVKLEGIIKGKKAVLHGLHGCARRVTRPWNGWDRLGSDIGEFGAKARASMIWAGRQLLKRSRFRGCVFSGAPDGACGTNARGDARVSP